MRNHSGERYRMIEEIMALSQHIKMVKLENSILECLTKHESILFIGDMRNLPKFDRTSVEIKFVSNDFIIREFRWITDDTNESRLAKYPDNDSISYQAIEHAKAVKSKFIDYNQLSVVIDNNLPFNNIEYHHENISKDDELVTHIRTNIFVIDTQWRFEQRM